MSTRGTLVLARRLSLVAGLLDLATGAGLVFQPGLTLTLMGASVPGPEALVQVRFVGAFVAAVGASYLLALGRRDTVVLRTMLEQTLLFRAAAGSYVAVACGLGWLDAAWLAVAVTDLALVIVQSVLLRRGL